MTSISGGLADFLIFFVHRDRADGAYLLLYTLATMHNEFALIRQNVISAAIALGFSLVGLRAAARQRHRARPKYPRLPRSGAWWPLRFRSSSIGLVRLVMPNLSQRIAAGEMAAALFLGAASLSAGIINAAAMTF